MLAYDGELNLNGRQPSQDGRYRESHKSADTLSSLSSNRGAIL